MPYKPFLTALRTLTVFPLPGKDTTKFHWALPFFPLVGIVLGSLQVFTFILLPLISVKLIPLAGLLVCFLNYLLTGALHLDGLADTADAFGVVRKREKILLILKDSHLGTFGVSAIVFMLLWRVSVYTILADKKTFLWLLPCFALSRTFQGILLCLLPYARDNSGKAFVFTGKPAFSVILIAEFFIFSIIMLIYQRFTYSLIPPMVGLLCTTPVIYLYLRRIQGITGDGIGAASELFEVGYLTAVLTIT